MIFSGDHFSGVYGWFVDDRDFYEGGSPPPDQRDCPDDIVNDLVAYRNLPKIVNVVVEKIDADHNDSDADDNNDFYYPLRVLSRNFGLGWKGAWHFHAQSPPPNH